MPNPEATPPVPQSQKELLLAAHESGKANKNSVADTFRTLRIDRNKDGEKVCHKIHHLYQHQLRF